MKTLQPKVLLWLLAGFLILASCSKNPTYDIGTSDLDMVYTHYDGEAEFASYKTYMMSDSINFDPDKFTPEEIAYLQDYYSEVFTRIDNNMQSRNFVKVDSTQDPDLGVTVTVITQTNYVVSWGYWWGWGYYPYYWGYPGYSYYYPWGYYMGSYEEGALVIEMADLENADTTSKKLDMVWASLVGGVLANDDGLIDKRLINQIDQSFEQSPYLQTNP